MNDLNRSSTPISLPLVLTYIIGLHFVAYTLIAPGAVIVNLIGVSSIQQLASAMDLSVGLVVISIFVLPFILAACNLGVITLLYIMTNKGREQLVTLRTNISNGGREIHRSMILIGSLVVTWVILPILVIGFPPMIIVGKSDVFAALNIYMLGLPLQVVLAFSVPILLIVMMVMMFITNRFGLKEGSNVAM